MTSSNDNVKVFPTPEAVAEAARHFILRVLAAAGPERPVHIVLAGGSTPERSYALLADAPQDTWDHVHFWFGDERTVAPDHDDSNYKMAMRSLLAEINIPDERIHRMRGEDVPHEAAAAYELEIRAFVPLDADGQPVFDLILLGLGDDGHTASLFPSTAALEETSRIAVANEVPQQATTRITLTFPALNAAAYVLCLVTGEGKAKALRDVLSGEASAPPAASVQPRSGEMFWYVDKAAASMLGGS